MDTILGTKIASLQGPKFRYPYVDVTVDMEEDGRGGCF